jgi:hypothetical protein
MRAAAAVLVLLGVAAEPAVQAFHDALLAGTRKLKAAGFRCAQPLPGLLAGNRDELPRLRAARDDAALLVRAVADEARGLAVPPDPASRDLHAAYLKYLRLEDRLVNKDLAELLSWLEDDKADGPERRERVARAVARMARQEGEELVALRRAYDRFVAEHGLKRP